MHPAATGLKTKHFALPGFNKLMPFVCRGRSCLVGSIASFARRNHV
jgi:hypothetical protein